MTVKSRKAIDISSILEGLDKDDAEIGALSESAKLLDLPAERVMSGRVTEEPVKKRTMVLEIDPRVCRRWHYYDRFDEWFTYENCRDLIDDIQQNEQEIPGIVRKLDNDPEGYKYEVIFGGRRHFAADYITENDGVLKPFKAIQRELSNQEAARLMDLENRKRADISDFERCVSYRQQLGKVSGYDAVFKTLNELRAAIESDKVDPGTSSEKSFTKAALSQMVTAGELNEISELICLFNGRRIHIPWSYAYKLMLSWNSETPGVRKSILKKAKELQEEENRITPEQLIRDLLHTVDKKQVKASIYKESFKLNGKIAIKAKASARDLSLKIPLKVLEKADRSELLKLINQAMDNVDN